jgi:hypothetical protein
VAGALAYVAVAVQVGCHLRRIGTFGPLTAALYPAPLLVFLALLVRSAVRGRRVRWKGRLLLPR